MGWGGASAASGGQGSLGWGLREDARVARGNVRGCRVQVPSFFLSCSQLPRAPWPSAGGGKGGAQGGSSRSQPRGFTLPPLSSWTGNS